MIRSHLDRETAQIDELIVKQKKLIEVLRERSSVVRERTLPQWSAPAAG